MTLYTKDHEWLTLNGDLATIGITRHAADALGDLVFVEVKPVGTRVVAGEVAAVVESVKAASDIFAPVRGEIMEANTRIGDDPSFVNVEPEAGGWLFKLRIDDSAELESLLDREAYDAFVVQS